MHVPADDDNGVYRGDCHPTAAAISGEEDVMTMLEDVEIDALFGSADDLVLQYPPYGQGEDSTAEKDCRSYGDGEVTECKPGNRNSENGITGDEIMDNELENSFDELFEESACSLPSHTLNLEPPPPVASDALPVSPVQQSATPELDLPTVMANIAMLKNSIVSNHLLLTRFLNLKSIYRSVSARLTNERLLYAQAQSTISSMREEISSMSHDSSFLQSQTTQLKEELQREHLTRTTSESTITQYQEEIKELKKQTDTFKKDKASAERRLAESLKEVDGLKMKVVTLMSEKRSLVSHIIRLGEQELAQDKSTLQEEVINLKNRIAQLEAWNIRLKAGRSILAGGEGNTLADFQSPMPAVPAQSTSTPITPSPPAQSPGPQSRLTAPTVLNNSDDEVIFMGTNLSSVSPSLASSSLVSPYPGNDNTIVPVASAAVFRSLSAISSGDGDGEIL